ncbi:hypothetical protein HN51_005893 [Arachis hypogaea]|nr:uncharacterized protein DS421_4g131530 [Arachis hypogaea]
MYHKMGNPNNKNPNRPRVQTKNDDKSKPKISTPSSLPTIKDSLWPTNRSSTNNQTTNNNSTPQNSKTLPSTKGSLWPNPSASTSSSNGDSSSPRPSSINMANIFGRRKEAKVDEAITTHQLRS